VFIFNNLSFLPYIDQIYNIYIIGDRWGGGASFDTNTFIARLITQAPFFYCILVLLISKRKDDFFILGAILVSVSLFLSQFWVVSERYQYVSVLLVTLHLIFNNEYFLLRRKIIILLYFVIQTAVLIWGLYRFRYMILPSLEFIIYPFLFCFYNTVDMNKLIKV
ncbi:O113 family O-antigen polymerase, partial [Escherichia coli]|nr:O113 family O-antigen polymerase [Escherichia coli]